MLSPEEIEQNWKNFRTLCSKLGDRSATVDAMLDELDERLCLCPASSRVDYHGAFAGGLVDHSLRVLRNLASLNKAHDWKLPKDSMIIGALFHDIGKVGMPGADQSNDFYIDQPDGWKRDKRGEVYAYNNDLVYMTTPDRSVFLMQHYGIKLTPDEWLSIKLNDGFILEANKPYCLKISPLVTGVMTADYISTAMEKSIHGWAPEE